MNISFLLYVLFSALVFFSQRSEAQSVAFSPQALSSAPKGATASNPYWQRLAITLSRNPSAGNAITLNLPSGLTIADRDGDGAYDDEVALDDSSSTGTGYTSAAGTSANQIVLTSGTGGVAGKVFVHFPLVTPAAPSSSSAIYGQVSFSNSGEQPISAGSLILSLVEPRDLSLATFSRLFIDGVADTTTNAQGDAYPDTATVAFAPALPDLVSDRRGNLSSNALVLAGVSFADGNNENDTPYQFWFSLQDTLARVDTSVAIQAINSTTQGLATSAEGDSVKVAFDVSALQDTTYYLYMTSSLTGNFPLLRSRGILVRHLPVVLDVGLFSSNDADFLDSGRLLSLDKGVASRVDSARDRVDIPFAVVDYDDSASVRLFYTTADSLDTTYVQTTGTHPNRVISALENATHIDSTASLFEGRDTQLNWKVATNDSVFVARGNYYVYAVITDGKELGIKRSAHTYNVRHSPFLALDSRRDRTIETGGLNGQRYYAITWNRDNGKDGDRALVDSALISLYYSSSDSFAVPSGSEALITAAADSTQDTHLIASGLQEQPDGRAENQYLWDLWAFKNADGGGGPREGVAYSLYGLVQTDSTKRVVRWDGESGQGRSLRFVHRPHLRILAPLSTLDIDGRRSFEVAWEAVDVDNAAGIWVLLTSATAAASLGDSTSYATLVADGISDWVANSADGSMATAVALSEDSTSTFSVRPSRLSKARDGAVTPIVDGDYYAYIIVDEGAGSTPADSALAKRAPGRVRISGLGSSGAAGLETSVVEFVPSVLTLTTPRDTALIEIRPHSGGQSVDLLAFFASVDTTFFSVVDQDTSKGGIQPFKLNSALSGIALRDTLLVGADSVTAGKYLLDLVYFEQGDNSAFDGDLSLATLQLVSRDTTGATQMDIDHFGNRQSAFYRDGEVVDLLAPETGLSAQVLPRGTVAGKVALQGRDNPAGLVTLLLRDRNSFLPISDSLFLARNDLDTLQVGVQDSLAIDGSYSLSHVPTGDYQLAVHLDGYLDGQYPALRVNPGVALTNINPTFLAGAAVDPGLLLGGDVTGYVDTSGASIPDNEIDQLDVDFIVAYFAQTVNATHAGRLADIDGDSLVWISDLNIVAANFNIDGVEPVFKRTQVPVQKTAPWRVDARIEDDELLVEVWGEGLVDARAYAFRLLYDDSVWQLVRVEESAFARRPAILARKRSEGQIALGAALSGEQAGVWGENLLTTMRFERLHAVAGDAHVDVQLRDAEWVDSAHRRHRPPAEGGLPTAFALLPNYPNPFNPQTQLRFALPTGAQVHLEIYDVLGQRVRTLLATRLQAGVHSIEWDGRDDAHGDVASGTYFLRLRSEGRTAMRKMLLLR
ncbi:MAG: hypothetical protein ACI906_000917 [Candidatus Latescibacterota bacterium]|jgi:hypothetical protein